MTKEEFLDKTTVANRTITNLQNMIEKIKQTKMEGVQIYIEMNRKFDIDQRVRVYENNDPKSNKNKLFVGFGYVKSLFVDEDYGIIVYSLKKEDKISKQESEEYYENCGASIEDYEYSRVLIEKA